MLAVRPRVSEDAPGRILEIDALRGLAALTVVVYHYTHRYNQIFGHADGWARWGGWRLLHPFGVPLFFLISGFVIPMTMDAAFARARGRLGESGCAAGPWQRWRRVALPAVYAFAAARIARLYPAFIVASVVIWLVVTGSGLPGRGVSPQALAAHLSFAPRAIGYPFVDPVFWTLQTELVFYSLVAVVAAAGLRRWLIHILGVLVVLDGLGMGLDARWHMFLIGAVLHDAWRRARAGAARGGFVPTHGVLLAIAAARIVIDRTASGGWRLLPPRLWGEPIALLLSAGVVALVTRRRVPLLEHPWLVFLGSLSYGLYLIHQNIGYAVMYGLAGEISEAGGRIGGRGWSTLPALGVALAVALGLAVALTYGVERPLERRLRPWLTGLWRGGSR